MNKLIIVAGLLILSLPVMAQPPGSTHINKAQIQHLMEQAKQVQACMAGIDQKLMDEFKRKAKQTDTEIKALCATGKRSAAEARAKKFSDEIAKSEVMRQTQKCTAGMMADLPTLAQSQSSAEQAGHICDR